MLRFSLPIGTFMGVDLRVHLSFPLLLLLSVAFSIAATGGATRGVGLWLALCFAVLVRETARAIAAAYAGLQLRAIFLLPVGGIMAFTSRDPRTPSPSAQLVSTVGPIANLAVGLLLLGISLSLEPHVSLLAQPWIGTGHILRSFIWMQIVLGGVSLLPTPAMPSLNALRSLSAKGSKASREAASTPAAPTPSPASSLTRGILPSFGIGSAIALVMIVAGFALGFLWLTVLGAFMLLGMQLSSVPALNTTTEADAILVREVMLTEYTLLSSSDTLQGALDRATHSMQDVFPVVRGNRLVGSIARQTIAERLLVDGNSYLQGIMTRSLQLAAPTEKLVEALRRAASLGASEFIPVVEDGAMIGILTPQSLSRAVQQVKLIRPDPANTRENNRD